MSQSRRRRPLRRVQKDSLGWRPSDKAVMPDAGYFLTKETVSASFLPFRSGTAHRGFVVSQTTISGGAPPPIRRPGQFASAVPDIEGDSERPLHCEIQVWPRTG